MLTFGEAERRDEEQNIGGNRQRAENFARLQQAGPAQDRAGQQDGRARSKKGEVPQNQFGGSAKDLAEKYSRQIGEKGSRRVWIGNIDVRNEAVAIFLGEGQEPGIVAVQMADGLLQDR